MTPNMTRSEFLSYIFGGSLPMAQTLLDTINLYRQSATMEYPSFEGISDERILYWVNIHAVQAKGEYRAQWEAVASRIKEFGIVSNCEGWGVIHFGVKVRGDSGRVVNLRHRGGKHWEKVR